MPNEVYRYSTWRWSLPWFRENVAHYGIPPAEIEASVVALSYQFWGEAGRLPPHEPGGRIWLWLGKCLTWIGFTCGSLSTLDYYFIEPPFTLRAASAIPHLFDFVAERKLAGTAFLVVMALFALIWFIGSRLRARGERLLRLVPPALAGKIVSSATTATRGRLLRALYVALCVALFGGLGALAMVDAINPDIVGNLPFWLLLPAFACFLGLCVIAQVASVRSKEFQAPSASDLQVKDPRKPVLLLRSFQDEELQVAKEEVNGEVTKIVFVRLEQAVSDQFARYGPLIAIGKPGEALPLLGAARNYYTDAEWKDAITRWMDQARILLVIPGLTPGLGWELDTIQRRGHFAKLLVLMPPAISAPDQSWFVRLFQGYGWDLNYDFNLHKWVSTSALAAEQNASLQRRWDALRQDLANAPAFTDLPKHVPDGLIALHLGGDGMPTLVRGGNMHDDYELAIGFAIYGMFGRGAAGRSDCRTP